MTLHLGQSPGGIGGPANEMSRAASDNGIQSLVIVAGIVLVIVVAVILYRLRKD